MSWPLAILLIVADILFWVGLGYLVARYLND